MMTHQNSPYFKFTDRNFDMPGIPALGLFVSLNFPSFRTHTHVVYEGMYFRRKLEAPEHILSPFGYSYVDMIYSHDVWQSTLTGKFELPGIRLRPAFNVGFFYNQFFNKGAYEKINQKKVTFTLSEATMRVFAWVPAFLPVNGLSIRATIWGQQCGFIHNQCN